MKSLIFGLLLLLVGCAHKQVTTHPEDDAVIQQAPATPARPSMAPARSEQIRTECVNGRRLICGRVLAVQSDGLVVESGYTDLIRPPLTESWVVPGTAVAHRDPNVLELNQPGTPCIGVAFLADLPRRPKVNNYDYVVIMGYPAGQYLYSPAPGVQKTIRKFAAGLETAVRLQLKAETDGESK